MDYVNFVDAICGICAALVVGIWSVAEYVKEEKINRANRRHVFHWRDSREDAKVLSRKQMRQMEEQEGLWPQGQVLEKRGVVMLRAQDARKMVED